MTNGAEAYALAKRTVVEGAELDVQLFNGEWARGRFTTRAPLRCPALVRPLDGSSEHDDEDATTLIPLAPSACLRWPRSEARSRMVR